jgi:hypothetical protein
VHSLRWPEDKKASYSLINNCYRRHNYHDYIGPGGRTPVENLDGEDVELDFFLVPGSGSLLLGNSLLHKAVVDGPDNLIEFTDAKSLRVVTPTYFDGVRTRLFCCHNLR